MASPVRLADVRDDPEAGARPAEPGIAPGATPLATPITLEELDTDEPIRAEPERVAAAPAPVSEPRSALNANWLVWSVVVGAALVIMVGVVEWVA